jgi:glycoprotein 3-alpha-L-fucosyltransferase/alpha-1,3-fucosyltransferase
LQSSARHYFYLAFEAAVCPDFLSERFWRLKNMIVPIVLTRSVVPSYIPSYAFIAVDDFPTLQDFVSYLFRVAKDREMYKR